MKKVFAIITVLALLLTPALSVSAVGGGTATVTSAGTVAQGDTITFTVTIDDAALAQAVMIRPVYDTAAFEPVGGEFLRDGALVDFGTADGVILWAEPTDINGILCTFTLRAKRTAVVGATYTVGCAYTYRDAADDLGEGAVVTASVTMRPTHGDINGDGDVNNRDLALIQQYINGWGVTIHEDAADVNNDGDINNRDQALLQQYINGWDVTLG